MSSPSNAAAPARPTVRRDRSPAARERRVLGVLNGGQSAAEIATREGGSERGGLKSVSALITRRASEAADPFIAVQVNRLYPALRTSDGATSAETLATVDRGGQDRARARPPPRP